MRAEDYFAATVDAETALMPKTTGAGRRGAVRAIGNFKVKAVPLPAELSTRIRP